MGGTRGGVRRTAPAGRAPRHAPAPPRNPRAPPPSQGAAGAGPSVAVREHTGAGWQKYNAFPLCRYGRDLSTRLLVDARGVIGHVCHHRWFVQVSLGGRDQGVSWDDHIRPQWGNCGFAACPDVRVRAQIPHISHPSSTAKPCLLRRWNPARSWPPRPCRRPPVRAMSRVGAAVAVRCPFHRSPSRRTPGGAEETSQAPSLGRIESVDVMPVLSLCTRPGGRAMQEDGSTCNPWCAPCVAASRVTRTCHASSSARSCSRPVTLPTARPSV
jgi:hypothetical protein